MNFLINPMTLTKSGLATGDTPTVLISKSGRKERCVKECLINIYGASANSRLNLCEAEICKRR